MEAHASSCISEGELIDLDEARVAELIARLKPRSGSAPEAKMVAAAAILASAPTLQVPEACRRAVSMGFDAVPQGSQVRVRPLAEKIAALPPLVELAMSPCEVVQKKRGRPPVLTPQEKEEAQQRHHEAKLEHSKQRTLAEQRRRIERPLERQLETTIITFSTRSPLGSTPCSYLVAGLRKELSRLSALVGASFNNVASTLPWYEKALRFRLSKVVDCSIQIHYTYEPPEQNVVQCRSRVIPGRFEKRCITTEPRASYHVLIVRCVEDAMKEAHGPRMVQLGDGMQLSWGSAPRCGLTVASFVPNV